MKKADLVVVAVALIVGGFLRFSNLGLPPFWCDEAFYATNVYHFENPQEFVPAVIGHVLGVGNEWAARFPFALCGTLTILAVYWVNPSKWSALLSLVVATFPLFVFYDRMCRPYAMAGLFVALAWRYRWMWYAVVLTTPTAILGVDVTRIWKEWKFYAMLFAATVILMFIRTDQEQFTVGIFLTNPRFWYVPILAAMLYVTYYILPKQNHFVVHRIAYFILAAVFLNQSYEIKDFNVGPPLKRWYSPLIYYNDWRGMPQVDLSTNFEQITRYYTGKAAPILRDYELHRIDSILTAKGSIMIGVDCYANHMSAWFFQPMTKLIDPYRKFLYDGGVMLVRLAKDRNGRFSANILEKHT